MLLSKYLLTLHMLIPFRSASALKKSWLRVTHTKLQKAMLKGLQNLARLLLATAILASMSRHRLSPPAQAVCDVSGTVNVLKVSAALQESQQE